MRLADESLALEQQQQQAQAETAQAEARLLGAMGQMGGTHA